MKNQVPDLVGKRPTKAGVIWNKSRVDTNLAGFECEAAKDLSAVLRAAQILIEMNRHFELALDRVYDRG